MERRAPARVITMAWGERYVTDLLRLAIPAVLAPGNIPAFCEHFDTELVIVTESRFFPLIVTAPAIVRALEHCDVRLVPIDDLLSPWYGVTLTHALHRGFSDLGERATDTHLIFLNADFIVADGSYRNLSKAILRGERLAVAPSYCMVLEETVPLLTAHYDRRSASLPVAPRALARMIVHHPHNTVRAKTINRPGLLTHRYDQFYWKVGEDTLLCRQMPIAVVYMRPTRIVAEMPTFWDYGVIAEMCPGVTPCVFSDSDDFLMGELRAEGTFRELMKAGVPQPEDIAHDLSSFTTQDHRDYGRHTLAVHGGDLPEELAVEQQQFEAYVDDIYDRLGPPLDHRNHPFWAPLQPAYDARHRAQLAALGDRGQAFVAMAALAEGHELGDTIHSLTSHIVDGELNGRADNELRDLRERLFAASERLHALADRHAPAKNVGRSEETGAGPRRFSAAWLLERYHATFGMLPNSTAWHPLHTVLRPVIEILGRTRHGSDALVISSGGLLTAPLSRIFTGRTLSLSTGMALAGLYQNSSILPSAFDVCLMDLAPADLVRVSELIDAVRPSLARDARIVVFCYLGDEPAPKIMEMVSQTAPAACLSFTGSAAGAIAAGMFLCSAARYDLGSRRGRLNFMAMLAVAAPLARLAAAFERNDAIPPAHCTSVTIEITPDLRKA